MLAGEIIDRTDQSLLQRWKLLESLGRKPHNHGTIRFITDCKRAIQIVLRSTAKGQDGLKDSGTNNHATHTFFVKVGVTDYGAWIEKR